MASPLILDTHIDIRWPDPPDPVGETPQQVDFPKMARGGMHAAVFIAYVPQGKRDPAGHAAAGERAEAMLRHIRTRADGAARRFCSTAAEVEAAHAAGAQVVLSAVENGYAMGHDLSAIGRWRALGAIYLTLTHNGHNDLSDSAIPRKELGDSVAEHHGLSPLGREAVAALNAAGVLVDVSHVSKAAMLQAAECSRVPVVATPAGGLTEQVNHGQDGLLAEAITAEETALGARGRVLIRASGTEPVIRVMAEAEDEALVDGVVSRLADLIKAEACAA
jgi:membrane dipeptidase